jgi:GxxExxY protein
LHFNSNTRSQSSTKGSDWTVATDLMYSCIELKSVDEIKRIHEAQLLTYVKLAEVKIGLLMNFNVTTLKGGIKRFVL